MHLSKFFVGFSLLTTIVSAIPVNEPDFNLYERDELDFDELVERAPTKLYASDFNRDAAISFIQSIPDHRLSNNGFARSSAGTIHTTDPRSGHRLDLQGKTGDGYYNLQVQLNGPRKKGQKTSVAGVLIKVGPKEKPFSAQRIKKELERSITHPAHDKNGNEVMRKLHYPKPEAEEASSAGNRKGKPAQRKASKSASKVARKK